MSHLFSPFTLRGVTLRNRVGVSPMCQYSCADGFATPWHLVHLGSRAVGGAGLVITEAAAVTPEGRISPEDLGVWDDARADALAPVAAFIAEQGAVPGIQLAHAGRKASTFRPWDARRGTVPAGEGGWQAVGASAVAFGDYAVPAELGAQELEAMPGHFAAAAVRAVRAGFPWLEVHGAHGYLLHSFLSPLSNTRTDAWGGALEGRAKLLLDVVRAIRAAAGTDVVVAVRVSATDWEEGGWSDADTVALAPLLAAAGADLVDCSSGGNTRRPDIPLGPGYQVPFAEAVRATGIATAAVGLITRADQAEAIVAEGRADVVLLARALLRDPYWPLHAAQALGAQAPVPAQYLRAFGA